MKQPTEEGVSEYASRRARAVITSPLTRALETTRIAFPGRDKSNTWCWTDLLKQWRLRAIMVQANKSC